MNQKISTTCIGVGMAVALSAFGCGGNNNRDTADASRTGAAAPGTTASANQKNRPVTLTGCLQKGDGRSDYILTQINTPRTTVGTSGAEGRKAAAENGAAASSGSSAGVVAQEQLNAAEHAYRLNGDHDKLEPLVGQQVRVSGTLTARSDLNARAEQGRTNDQDRRKIDESDLAKVDVASIDSTAENCGGGKAERK